MVRRAMRVKLRMYVLQAKSSETCTCTPDEARLGREALSPFLLHEGNCFGEYHAVGDKKQELVVSCGIKGEKSSSCCEAVHLTVAA